MICRNSISDIFLLDPHDCTDLRNRWPGSLVRDFVRNLEKITRLKVNHKSFELTRLEDAN